MKRPAHRRLRLLGYVLVAASLVFLALVGAEHARTAFRIASGPASLGALTGAAGLYGLTQVIGGVSWWLLVRGEAESVSPTASVRIVLGSNVAKYLPGNVGHYVGRVALARRMGIAAAPAVATLAIEGVGNLTMALTLGLSGLVAQALAGGLLSASARLERSLGALDPLYLAGAVLFVVVAAVAWASAGHWSVGKWLRVPRSVRPRTLAVCLVAYGVNFVLMGCGAALLAHGFLGLREIPVWLLTGSFALAWAAGFVVPGSPGGLGVREAVLVAQLGPAMGAGSALSLAVVLRLATVTGDAVGFGVGALWARFSA